MNSFKSNKICIMSLGVGAFVMMALLACSFVGHVESQVEEGSATPSQIPRQFGLPTGQDFAKFMDSLVHTGPSELGGLQVKVHLPIVYDLVLDTRPDHMGLRMNQTVLSGFFQLYMDRYREVENGPIHGPVSIRLVGWPLYENVEAKAKPAGVPTTFTDTIKPTTESV